MRKHSLLLLLLFALVQGYSQITFHKFYYQGDSVYSYPFPYYN